MKRNRRQQIQPDLTSLIDVVFLLLVFFMAVSTIEPKKRTLQLELPKTDGVSTTKTTPYVIELNDTSLVIDGQPATSVLDIINDREKVIEIYADKGSTYNTVASVLSKLQLNDFTKINLIVNQ